MSSMANSYVSAGYVGKAGVVLARAKAILEGDEKSVISSDAVRYWRLCYSLYLSSIGNIDKRFASYLIVILRLFILSFFF